MTIFNTLKKLGLASEETSVLFHKGVRDNPDLNVFKDISSGVIFIKDFYSGDETYEQKLAIPAYKRKNINLDNDASDNDQTKTLDFTEED